MALYWPLKDFVSWGSRGEYFFCYGLRAALRAVQAHNKRNFLKCKIFFQWQKNGRGNKAFKGVTGGREGHRGLIRGSTEQKKRYKLSFNRHLYLFFSKAFIAPRGRESLGLYLGEDLC
jgi:hypothetical protein